MFAQPHGRCHHLAGSCRPNRGAVGTSGVPRLQASCGSPKRDDADWSGARRLHAIVGWGWMLWDFNWFRPKTAASLVPRFVERASPGDIFVIHDGHHKNPRADRRYAVETVDRLIPELKARGFQFGRICRSVL